MQTAHLLSTWAQPELVNKVVKYYIWQENWLAEKTTVYTLWGIALHIIQLAQMFCLHD